MKNLLLIFLIAIVGAGCASVSEQSPDVDSINSSQALQDEEHSKLCKSVFEDYRNHVKIGMTSKAFASVVDSEYTKEAYIKAITAMEGEIPLQMDNSSSICYVVILYPNEKNRRNYFIFFRISKPLNARLGELDDIGRAFLRGDLKDSSVVLKEFALRPAISPHIEIEIEMQIRNMINGQWRGRGELSE